MKAFYEKKLEPVHVFSGSNMNFPAHLHKEAEIIFCTGGQVHVRCGLQQTVLGEREFMIAMPNTIHSYSTPENCEYVVCIFDPSHFPQFKSQLGKLPATPFLWGEAANKIGEYLSELQEEFARERNKELMNAYLSVVLALTFKKMSFQEKTSSASDDVLPDILLYLEEHYLEEFTLDSVAAAFGLNASYLSRMFSKRIHCTLTRYLHELRINYARHLLQTTDRPVTEIAYECGFSTQRTFNRVFLEIEKVSPRSFRKESPGKINL